MIFFFLIINLFFHVSILLINDFYGAILIYFIIILIFIIQIIIFIILHDYFFNVQYLILLEFKVFINLITIYFPFVSFLLSIINRIILIIIFLRLIIN